MDTNVYYKTIFPGYVVQLFTPEQLVDYKGFLLEKYSDLERQVRLVNDILDGYGVNRVPDFTDNIIPGEN